MARSRAMFFFLPWGHDSAAYDRPWATIAFIASCVLVHLALFPSSRDAEVEIERAALEISSVLEQRPDAHIGFHVNGLPRSLDAIVQPMIDTTGERAPDVELEEGVRHLVRALNGMPAFRFGWRAGEPAAFRALTSIFVHADVFHLFGNMILLWVAGGLIEVFWNRWAFVALYLFSGLAGVLAQHLADPSSLAPLIGASGAIAGLLGALVMGYPSARIKIFYFLFVFIRPIWGNWHAPAWFVIPLWAGWQLLFAVLSADDGGVAYWAHVGGFACGAILAVLAKRMNLIALDAGHEVVRDEAPVVAARRAPSSTSPLAGPRSAPEPSPAEPPRAPSRAPAAIELDELPPARDDDGIER